MRCERPTPAQIRAAREAAGLSTAEAADLVGNTARAWQMWESGERGMQPIVWLAFRHLAGLERLPFPGDPVDP